MTLVWPFPTRDDGPNPGGDGSGQWRRVDEGQDLQGTGSGEEDVLAVAAGLVVYAHDPGDPAHPGAHFGDPYPVLVLDVPIGGNPAIYYGHTHPVVVEGTHVAEGTVIARTSSPGGGGAPPHWLEIGWWHDGPTGDGAAMHDALITAQLWEDHMSQADVDAINAHTDAVKAQLDSDLLATVRGFLTDFWANQFEPALAAVQTDLDAIRAKLDA